MRGRRGQLERSGSSTGFDVYTPDLYSVVEGSGPGEGDVTSVFIIEAWALEEQILQRLGAV